MFQDFKKTFWEPLKDYFKKQKNLKMCKRFQAIYVSFFIKYKQRLWAQSISLNKQLQFIKIQVGWLGLGETQILFSLGDLPALRRTARSATCSQPFQPNFDLNL